ncbi:hypothetical protein [Shewanella colwelliana]|uniref:hypothetical protein n=1 Tax=Shewanella colwelliana TaxID=23 RepID=UPI003734D280
MSKIIKQIYGRSSPCNQAMVEIDADPLAERVFITDRNSGYTIWNTPNSQSGLLRLIVPFRFATSSDLLVGILDDSRVYNTRFVDGVKAQIVDGNVIKASR